MLHNIEIILRWISNYWFPSIPESTRLELITYWIKIIHVWVIKNGPKVTIKRIKLIRLITTRYICGQPLLVNDQMVGVTPDGFAKSFLPFRGLIDSGNPEGLRFALTCLGISRSFPTPGPIDYSTIEKPWVGKYKKFNDDKFIKIFVQDFSGHFNPLVDRPSPHQAFLSLKSGPLAGPAILAAQVAASRFTGANLWGLAGIGGDSFMNWVKALKMSVKINQVGPYKFSKEDISLRKMSWGNRRFIHISDPEMKHRIVGCYDYISQLAFNPLSEWLFNCLRNIPYDRTFTQDPIIKDKDNINSYHSLDLSAATDRFPIDLQVQLLSEIAGPFYAACWKNLMVAEPFVAHDFLKEGIVWKKIFYSVGQPMGARSSWAMFTLTHHLVVQYAAYQNDCYPFKKYILLGDDIVIYDNNVAETYKAIMSDLGVEISPSKSHVSKDTYEFAKRWFRNGIEVSPIPVSGFVSNFGNPKLLYSQIMDLLYQNRGPRSIVSSIDLAVSLISQLRIDKTLQFDWGFYGHWFYDKLQCDLKYTKSEIKYFRRCFEELNLVYRNTKVFDAQATRRFMCESSCGNDYSLPHSDATLAQEWIRTSSGVVNSMAMSVVKKLTDFYGNFKKVYPEVTNTVATVSGQTPMELHPLTYAVYNSIKTFSDMNKKLGYTTDLMKQLETVTVLNLDQLSSHQRTSIEMVFTFSTLGRKLRNQIKSDPFLIIAKARTMQFGASLFGIQLQMQREYPVLKRNR